MSYTNLTDNDLWNKFESQLDKYCTFTWDDTPMTNYHAFIVGSKEGSVKFHNGPSFSNSYSSPQFQSTHSSLTSINFKTMSISFTVGVYAFTAELYRKLIYKLNPYTIGNLIFDFQPKWRYVVKLASIDTSSPRYYLGQDGNGEDLYYTEFQLTYDIQGDAVALSVQEVSYQGTDTSIQMSDTEKQYQITFNQSNLSSPSELNTPFLLTFKLTPTETECWVSLNLQYSDTDDTNTHSLSCFNLYLQHLNTNTTYWLTYDSQVGQLFISANSTTTPTVLSLLTYNHGYRIVSSLQSTVRLIPGSFERGDLNQVKLLLSYSSNCTVDLSSSDGLGINCYCRRNII